MILIRWVVLIFLGCLLAVGCQIKPTVVKDESANHYNKALVVVDTRSALDYFSFHIPGSVSLNSADFLILKNPRTKKRVIDPDLEQIVERLAKRGISPLKTIVLISEKKDSDENKKWNWLFLQLDIRDVAMMGLEDYLAHNKRVAPQATPDSVPVWEIKKKKFILKKADECFVNWSDYDCL